MKRYIPSILAVLSLITAMSITSCHKVEPIIENPQKGNTTPEKGNSEEGEKTDPAEKLLLLVAQNGYTVYEYSQSTDGHKFIFHEPKVIESIKDNYPEGVGELTVPAALVTKVDETTTKYTVSLKSGKTATLNRYAEFRITLAAHKDTTVYKGVAFEVPFEVTASNGKTVTVSDKQTNGADVEVTLHETSGIITITPTADKGSINVTLSNGLLEVESEIAFDTYFLNVTGVPESYGDGNKYSFELDLDTNLPVEEILIESDPWIETKLQDARIAVKIDANGTSNVRTGEIAIKEAKGFMEPVIVEIKQDNILNNREGMVQFKDRAFKNACLEIADSNHDGDISPEEALTVTELNISGKGIKDLSGIEAFKNMRKLDASDNDIHEVDFSNPGSFACLTNINLKRNKNLKYGINISGCYAGITTKIEIDNYNVNEVGAIIYESPSYYASNDFSYSGEHIVYEHTKGIGIRVIFLVTEYLDVDYKSGAVNEIIQFETNELFSVEPFASMKDYFDIYEYAIIAKSTEEKGTIDKKYQQFLVSLNRGHYLIEINLNSGVERANAISYRDYLTKSTINFWNERTPGITIKETVRRRIIVHEFGHAIGGLADQYEEERVHHEAPNYTKNKSSVPWQRFLEIEKYKTRIKETYINSGYYPSTNSIMGHDADFDEPQFENGGYFDSPSRFAIYKNIIWLSDDGLSWPGQEQVWQDFLKYDTINDSCPI